MKRALSLLGVAAATALFTFAAPASAVPINLDLVSVVGRTVGPQSASNPCIIAATTCQQPVGMGYNNFTASGNISSYNMYSTTPTGTVADGVQGTPYTVGDLRGFLNSNTFVIAIDVNTTSAAGETLQLFEVIIGGVVAYVYNGPTVIGGISNNGNGYGDWYLSDVDLSSYAPGTTVLFHARWNNASDGGESFFLVPTRCDNCTPELPEPGTLALIGLALTGLGLARRRQV